MGDPIGKKCEFKPEFVHMQGKDLTVQSISAEGRVTMTDPDGIEYVANFDDLIIKF